MSPNDPFADYDYLSCYRTLGLTDYESDWDRVRIAYRRLISSWHPDRVAPSELPLAEERTKAINTAYELLAGYYHANGCLPRPSGFNESRADYQDAHAKQPQPPKQHDSAAAHSAANAFIRRRKLLHPASWALIIVLCGYVALNALTTEDRNPAASPVMPPSHPAPPNASPHHFSVGSTVGEVLAIQGRPSRTEADTWYYGTSTVLFENGHVVSWNADPGYPLHARDRSHNKEDDLLELAFFGVGSNRSTVRAIQGPPTRSEGNTWYYGDSKVHFIGDRVTSWDETPLSPLRVQR
ncbi:MAG: hypothetical protein AMJ84_02545 [Acidithiobacillales bacterium SM23_46]|jgi:outer membrane protein assembly factor BamE (lipoprotein component of BamABCDE complex)|nr:MAG: hypothetical protein AMS22_00430 [Thiotrichales bacterium SG8_50]KPK73250.1 MAG: hypothetical protein AMJ84_02545 [Acidithiobacillales bacterium SM23_46]